jgi:hypothetical protein
MQQPLFAKRGALKRPLDLPTLTEVLVQADKLVETAISHRAVATSIATGDEAAEQLQHVLRVVAGATDTVPPTDQSLVSLTQWVVESIGAARDRDVAQAIKGHKSGLTGSQTIELFTLVEKLNGFL